LSKPTAWYNPTKVNGYVARNETNTDDVMLSYTQSHSVTSAALMRAR